MKSKDNKSKKKHIGFVITIIALILVVLVVGITLCIFSVIKEEGADKAESFYFWGHDVTTESTCAVLYYYDAETGHVSEYDRFEGYSAVTMQINDKRTVIVGSMERKGEIPAEDEYYFVRYRIENKEIELISYQEIEESYGVGVGLSYPTDINNSVCFAGSMDNENGKLYLYDFDSEEVIFYAEIPEYSFDKQLVGNQIYYVKDGTGDIYAYDTLSEIDTCIVQGELIIRDFRVSADGSKIIFYNYSEKRPFCRYYVYVYDIATQEIECVGKELFVDDVYWVGEQYAYVMQHYGIINTCNPAIKLGTIESGSEEIYEQKGTTLPIFLLINNY